MNLTIGDISVVMVLNAILVFLSSKWIETRLTNSIKHEYDKELEKFKAQLKKQEQAARVARLLAMAVDHNTTDREFNELAWELSLWLPKDLVWDLTQCLCKADGALQIKEVLIKIRSTMNGENDGLEAGQISHRSSNPNLTNVSSKILSSEIRPSTQL